MMNKKMILAASVLAAATMGSSAVLAESPLTANISVTNNYLFRGLTQTADQAAVQGGIDYAHSSGFYAGTWLSNVSARGDSGGGAGFYGTNGNYEQDLYAGFSFDAGPVGLDVGYIKYMYPVDSSNKLDYDEVYVNASWMMLSANVSYTVSKEDKSITDKNDLYYSLGADFDIKDGLMLGLLVGKYDFDGGTASDYTHYMVSLSKDDFTFAFEKNNAKEASWWTGVDDNRFTVSWGKSFDL
ncbi:MAG TPA: hypothetical protein ENI94_09310 [Gammaproteobacteria bacterium]|nr:hypothetical protein [Gammaproteobacteria bacterium]